MKSVAAQISLSHTLDSGQVFRYFKENGGYRIVHGEHAFWVGDGLRFEGIPKSKLVSFFRLNDDYDKILNEINKDNTMSDAIKQYYGLRLMRQEPWECMVSFLCSSATNIPRIKRDLNNIAKTFGYEHDGFHLFPKVGEIDNLQKLKKCGTGFRAKYIYAVNNIVNPSFFKKLKRKPYQEAKAALMELPGIGTKIADCILLFSLDHLEAFPVDVWMEKVLKENYEKVNNKEMLSFAQDYFKPYAGYAQQFLYHWRRCSK